MKDTASYVHVRRICTDTSTKSLGVRLPLRNTVRSGFGDFGDTSSSVFLGVQLQGRGAECQASVVEWDTKCGVLGHSVVCWDTKCGVVGHKIQFQFNGQRFQNKEMSFARDYLQADGKTLLDEYLCFGISLNLFMQTNSPHHTMSTICTTE